MSPENLLKIKTVWNYFTPKAKAELLLFFTVKMNYAVKQDTVTVAHAINPILLSVILTEEDLAFYTNDQQKESLIQFSEEFKKFAERLEYKFGGSPTQVPYVYPHLYEHILTEPGREALTESLQTHNQNLEYAANELFEGYLRMRKLEDIFNII
jgi:hypothetical protein